MPKSASLASTLCSAAACLLTSTWHRPARRQGAVLVANLSATQPLRAALLAGSSSCRYSIETSQGSGTHVGLIQFLVAKVMGKVEDRCHDKSSEEEIGTRRECMRALVNFSTSALIRNDVSTGEMCGCLANIHVSGWNACETRVLAGRLTQFRCFSQERYLYGRC